MEQEIRKAAIKRFIQGEKPKQIYDSLNRSKPWFFKWLKRYQSGDPNWFKGQSRTPKHSPRALRSEDKNRIIETRRHLDAQRFAQFGPSAIKWELKKAGHQLPSDSTIKRVLRDEGLIKKKLVTSPRVSSIHILKKRSTSTTSIRPTLSDHGTSKGMASFTRSM